MNVELVDIGANMTHESFAADRAAVIARAVAAGVSRLVITGADVDGSRAAAELTALYPLHLWSTAGVHPHHAAAFDSATRGALLELLHRARVVAVGECGLDYFRDYSTRTSQRKAFQAQLELAVETRKPVFLHQRDSHADFMSILREFAGRLHGGVAHCFTGDRAELDDYLDFGLHIGITGWVCDERRGRHLHDLLPAVPADRLMLETDSPYLLPRDLRPRPQSRRNEPMHLAHVARVVAAIRAEPVESLASSSSRTAINFFGLV